jgi:hypothetical protein
MLTSDFDETTDLQWITPPECGGQIIDVSYAADGNRVLMHVHDRSDGSHAYYSSKRLADDEGDYWNGSPANRRWKRIATPV